MNSLIWVIALPIPELTVNELISVIKKSNLFNVVVEGKDDIVAFRVLERKMHKEGKSQVSLISTGGRDKLLQVFKGIEEDPAISRCIFICDKDTWVFSGVPEAYPDEIVVKTDGYSIENDLIRDYPPEDFMTVEEAQEYKTEVDYFSQWFTIEVTKVMSEQGGQLKTFPGTILDAGRQDLTPVIQEDEVSVGVFDTIVSDPSRFVRGKSMLQIAMRQLSKRGREHKHHHLSFLEHGANVGGENFARISSAVLERVTAAG